MEKQRRVSVMQLVRGLHASVYALHHRDQLKLNGNPPLALRQNLTFLDNNAIRLLEDSEEFSKGLIRVFKDATEDFANYTVHRFGLALFNTLERSNHKVQTRLGMDGKEYEDDSSLYVIPNLKEIRKQYDRVFDSQRLHFLLELTTRLSTMFDEISLNQFGTISVIDSESKARYLRGYNSFSLSNLLRLRFRKNEVSLKKAYVLEKDLGLTLGVDLNVIRVFGVFPNAGETIGLFGKHEYGIWHERSRIYHLHVKGRKLFHQFKCIPTLVEFILKAEQGIIDPIEDKVE